MSRLLQMPSEQAIARANASADRILTAEEFRAAADSPLSPDERERYHELVRWFSRRYPTPAARLTYVRRAMSQIAHAPSAPTALVVEAHVGPGGRRTAPGATGSIRVCLMNVLRWTATDLTTRWDLLMTTIEQVHEAAPGPTVLLTPGGYFGHDSVNGRGRHTLKPAFLDRNAVVRALQRDLQLPAGFLLAVGMDWTWDRQNLFFIERGRWHEIRRGQSLPQERVYDFAGLKLFGVICGEFGRRSDYGPMYGQGPAYFSAERDILAQSVDVVLDAAHIEVKCRQRGSVALNRFPFERFLIDVSRAGAAGFLAHHHPDERWPGGRTKNHSYSNWGIFAGTGADEDWLPPDAPVQRLTL